jgi:hypothetical protein
MSPRKKANPWDEVFGRLQVYRRPESLYVPPATEAELDNAESELGSRLPASYRAFLMRYGPGRIHDWVDVYGVVQQQSRYGYHARTLVGATNDSRDFYTRFVNKRNRSWLLSVVHFGSYQGNAEFVWDPAEVVTSRPREYRIFQLPRLEEENPIPIADSFSAFLSWVDADIRRWREPDDVVEMGPGIEFSPTHLRGKKAPLKRDVKVWLEWNTHTIRDIALSIREDKRTDSFPILADALEEAGCTNTDLLDSCRRGDPDTDGAWVLRVLLGR